MTGIAGLFGQELEPAVALAFLRSTDLRATGCIASFHEGPASISVSAPNQIWLSRRFAKSDKSTVVCAGHPVVKDFQSWDDLLGRLRLRDYHAFRALAGRFAVAMMDHEEPTLYIATDRLAQYPLYISESPRGLAFSTSQASFCTLRSHALNERWLYETFLVNFSASHQSFNEGVDRIPPATVLRLDLRSGDRELAQYASRFRAQPRKATARDEAERAKWLFATRIPRYLGEDEQGLIGLSGGFDSRTLLSYFAERPNVLTYTYGIEGCSDIAGATAVARDLHLRHSVIRFDGSFVSLLPEYIRDAVWLSSGLQRAARATLVHVYTGCEEIGLPLGCVLSGVSADQLFRGHGNVPSIISEPMQTLFRSGNFPTDLHVTCSMMFKHPQRAMDTMDELRRQLIDDRGDQRNPAAHLAFMTYEVPAEYFAGEACLADQFGDFRSPFCDPDIVEFAHSTWFSTLGFSKFSTATSPLLKNYLSAALISTNPRVARCPIHGTPIRMYAERKRLSFLLHRAFARVRRTMRREAKRPPLENWAAWFRGPLYPSVSALLGKDARVRQFLVQSFVDSCLERRNAYWLSKLVTVEMVLRMAAADWRRDGV